MRKQILLSAATLALMAGCTDNINNSFDEAKDKGTITVSVIDGNSREAVDSAEVKIHNDEEVSLSDGDGFVVYKKNVIGTYVFDISKKGYSTTRAYANVTETGANDVARVPDVLLTVPLYKSDVTLKGKVYYTDEKTGNLKPAKDAQVVLSYVSAEGSNVNIYPSEVIVETNEDGEYEFEDIAEKVSYSIDVLQKKIDSKYYCAKSPLTAGGLRAGSVKNLSELILVPDGDRPILLGTNFNDVEEETTLEISYSMELESDSVNGNWAVYTGISMTNANKILVKASLDKSKKVINISPISGKWSSGKTYTVVGVAYNKDGFGIDFEKSFSLEKVSLPGQVSDFKVSLDKSQYDKDEEEYYNFNYNGLLKLTWKYSKKDADGFNIYYKLNSDADYAFYTSVVGLVDSVKFTIEQLKTGRTELLSSVPVLLADTDTVKTISFAVAPYNEAGEATDGKQKTAEWKVPDIKKPDVKIDDDDDDEEDDDSDDE